MTVHCLDLWDDPTFVSSSTLLNNWNLKERVLASMIPLEVCSSGARNPSRFLPHEQKIVPIFFNAEEARATLVFLQNLPETQKLSWPRLRFSLKRLCGSARRCLRLDAFTVALFFDGDTSSFRYLTNLSDSFFSWTILTRNSIEIVS